MVVIIIIVRVVHLMFRPVPRDEIQYRLDTIQPAEHQQRERDKHNVQGRHIAPMV